MVILNKQIRSLATIFVFLVLAVVVGFALLLDACLWGTLVVAVLSAIFWGLVPLFVGVSPAKK